MTFEVLKEFEAQTPEGTLMLKEGQKLRLSKEEAIPLIQDGLIQPLEKVAYKIYSEPLQAYLWVVASDEDTHFLRSKNVTDPIYTNEEIRKLKGIDKDTLKEIHKVKEVFELSQITEVKKRKEIENV
jgi:hypothetical protein